MPSYTTVEAVFRDGAGRIKCGLTQVYAKDMPDTHPSVYGDRVDIHKRLVDVHPSKTEPVYRQAIRNAPYMDEMMILDQSMGSSS